MQVTLLTDFLGAGKTTFLKRLLHAHPDRRFGVIVNDFSELEVDGELVRLGHAVGEESGTRSTGNLLAGQLQAASVIVVSRIDLVPEDALPLLLRSLQVIHPVAALAACACGGLDATVLFDAPPHAETAGASRSATAPGEEDGPISAVVIRDLHPLQSQRFYDLYREHLPLGLYRSKGFLWFASRSDQCLLWNQAGGAMGLELISYWRAHILEHDTRLLPEEREHLGNKMRDTHSVFGDCACELTLIGLPRDRNRFATSLRDCFCTEAEIARWQAGGDFPDPWPKRLKLLQ